MSEEVINLPSRFEQLEYLESTGSQYIDIDYIPTNTTGFWVDAEQITHSNGVPVGSGCDRNSPADAMMPPRWLKSTNNSAGFGWGGWSSWGAISNGGRFISKLNFYNDKKAYLETLGDNPRQLSRDLGELSFTPTKSTLFFKTSVNPGVADYNWYGRIYEVKITQDTEIIRDFIPAYDKVLEKPCMFDLVTQTSYYNQGSGEFLYYHEEPIISIPYGYKRCIFLESTGTQYIDTQIAATSSHGLWADVLGTSSEDRNIFGCSHIETVDGVEQITSLSLPKNNSTHSYYYGLSQGNFTEDSTYYNKRYTKFINYLNLKLAGLQKLNTANTSALVEEEFELESNIFLFTNNETIRNEDGTISSTIGAVVDGEINPNTFIGKIYRAKITHEENVIADFIPCLDDKGKPCMYDLISQTPFYNANTEGNDFRYVVKGKIPSWYKRVKYLESTGTQYIKTGYVPTNTTGLYIDTQDVGSSDTIPMGLRESSSTNTRFFITRQTTSHSTGYGWGTWTEISTTKGSVRYDSTLNWLNDRKSITNNPLFGTIIKNLGELPFTPSLDIWMFGINQGGSHAYKFKGRIYRAKISEGSEVVRDFVPAFDTEEQRPCMYDLIEGIPYYNAGSGEFLYNKGLEGSYIGFGQLSGIGNRLGGGTDGLPPAYTRVNYLESTGTQYMLIPEPFIFTGTPSTSSGIMLDVEGVSLRTIAANAWGIRAYNKNDTTSWIMSLVINLDYSTGTFGVAYNGRNGIYQSNVAPCICYCNFCGDNKRRIVDKFEEIQNDVYIPAWGTMLHNGSRITLFCCDDIIGNALINKAAVRIKSGKISQGEEITRDLIPCLDANGRPCMFDRVSRMSFYNSGTGEFLYG